MAAKTGFFRASFSLIPVWSAALVIALIVQASPTHAETLNLVCEYDKGGANEFLIDLDQKTALSASSKEPPDHAEITERRINWKTNVTRTDGAGGAHNSLIELSIDRLTGTINIYEDNDKFGHSSLHGKCSQATKKF